MPNTLTPNVGLSKPALGDLGWNTPLNGDFDIIDGCFGATTVVPSMAITGKITHGSAGVVGWSSTTNALLAADTGLSRDSAGVVDVGNGTQGDKSGTIQATIAALVAAGILKWSTDTGLSRIGIGAAALGNGAQGDFSGTLKLTTLTLQGLLNNYNGIATAGNGASTVHAITSQKTESALDNSVLSFTPPAVAGSYRIRFVMAVSAQNTATLGWTATWKDSNSAAQAPTNLALYVSGTAAPALTFVAVTNGNYYADLQIDIDNSATPIVVKLTFSGTSFTAKVTASIERII